MLVRKNLKRFIFVFILAGSLANASNIHLGIIEETSSPCDDKSLSMESPPIARVVRPLFSKEGERWIQESRINSPMNWTMAFDGKTLGQISTKGPFKSGVAKEKNSYNLQEIEIKKTKLPSIENQKNKFGSSTFVSNIKFRPIAVVSEPNFKDPQKWKKSFLEKTYENSLREAFVKSFPKATNCDLKTGKVVPWQLQSAQVKILSSFKSNINKYLLEAKSTGWICSKFKEVGDEDDDPASPSRSQWFYIDGQSVPRLLDGGLQLVDAGDYDGDGQSELLFQKIINNSYILYWQNFEKKIEALPLP
jgi:hypothetical protein